MIKEGLPEEGGLTRVLKKRNVPCEVLGKKIPGTRNGEVQSSEAGTKLV